MTPRVGFFDGAEGERSMTRLGLFCCYLLESAMILGTVFVAVWGAIHPDSPAPTILAALTLANAPLITGILLTLREKRMADGAAPDPEAPS